MYKKITWNILLTVTILISCQTETQEINSTPRSINNIEVNANPSYQIYFRRDVTYGNSENVLLISPGGFEVDQQNRVFIADRHEIKVFSEDGEILGTLGGRGRGPGEFESVSFLEPKIGRERLFVYDEILQRINIYDTRSLTFIKSIVIEPRNWRTVPALKESVFKNYFVLNDSTLFVSFEDYVINHEDRLLKTNYYLMNLDGDIYSEKIFSHNSNTLYEGIGTPGPIRIAREAPFPNASTRSTLLMVDDEWNIYSVWTDEFRVKVHNIRSGTYYDIFYPFENSKLNPIDIISSYERNDRMYQRAKHEDFLATWPAIDHFVVDDKDRIWIATITNDEDTFEWWVISNRGDFISKFSWPGKRLQRHRTPKQIQAVRNGYLYAREENKETGQVKFVRYKIIFEVKTNE